jgi:hypothetical protein
MITIPFNGMANTIDLVKEVDSESNLKYLVGPVSFSDIAEQATMEMWNESLTDSIIEDGHLLMDMDYELKAIDGKVFIEVNADASEWASQMCDTYEDELKAIAEQEAQRDQDEFESNGGFV